MAVTNEYRLKQDLLGEWWEALLVDGSLEPNQVTAGTVIRAHYEDWAREHGATPVQAKRFRDYVLGKGLVEYRTKRMRGYRGIRVEVDKDVKFKNNLNLDAEADTVSPDTNARTVSFPNHSR